MIAALLRYWHLAVIGALVALLGVQQLRVADLKVDLTNEQKAASELRADRERVAREHADQIAELEHQHATTQAEQESRYAKTFKALEDQRRTDSAAVSRMRDIIAAYAASGGRTEGDIDAAAAQRAADRIDTLASLLAESVELVIEGRGIVQRRDAEVARLLDQIKLDRATCSANAATASAASGR